MSRFTAIDLSSLSPPDVIERLDFEAIVTDMRNDLVVRFPAIAGVIDLESEPARKLIQAFAYREMLLRGRINDAARAVFLASASGADLDHIAALFGTQRQQVENETGALVMESDTRLRRRVQLAPEAFSVAGPAGAYIYHALKAAAWARDATAITTGPGTVRVTLLREGGNPCPSDAEIETVKRSLIDNDVRPLTDIVEVLGPRVQRVHITATLTLYPGPDGGVVQARALAALTEWVQSNRMLGMNLRRSAIFSKLHQDGVHSVNLTSPTQDMVLGPTEVYAIDAIDISVATLRDE
jgi:phage-related baseplate assembly protein